MTDAQRIVEDALTFAYFGDDGELCWRDDWREGPRADAMRSGQRYHASLVVAALDQSRPTAEEVARMFHEAYERLAPDFGYKTREASAVPWEDVPTDNKALMIATVGSVLAQLREA